mgnify:CR=1 FL=1
MLLRLRCLVAAAVVVSGTSTFAQQLTPKQQREIRAEATAIAKAMVAEALVRACPDRFALIASRSVAHRTLLTKGASWNPDQGSDIATQVNELRSVGCDRAVEIYRSNPGRYSALRLSK